MSKILGNYCPVCLHNPCTCKPSVIPQHFDSGKINEEKLDRLALDYVGNQHGYHYQDIDDLPEHLLDEFEAYKAGYRSKAMEE